MAFYFLINDVNKNLFFTDLLNLNYFVNTKLPKGVFFGYPSSERFRKKLILMKSRKCLKA